MLRRQDNALRQSISILERMLLTVPSPDMIISRTLRQLVSLTNAQYGFAYICKPATDGTIPWALSSCVQMQGAQIVDYPNTCSSSFIPSELINNFIAGRFVFSSQLSLLRPPCLDENFDLQEVVSIPLAGVNKVYGAIYLCNSPVGFGPHIESRFRPLLAVVHCLFKSIEHRSIASQQSSLNVWDRPESVISLLDNLFNTVLLVDDDDTIVLSNQAAAEMFGVPRRSIVGQSIAKFIPKGVPYLSDRMNLKTTLEEAPARLAPIWRGVPAIGNEGKKILVDLSAFEVSFGGKNFRALVLDDISEKMQSAENYHVILQRMQALTNLAPIGILQLNENWECNYVNDTWCDYCQMTADESLGIGWFNGLHLNDSREFLEAVRRETAVSGKFEGECRLQTPLGKTIWVKANACSLFAEDGACRGMIMTFIDITVHLNNEQRLKELAEKDQLTGLVNRTFFNDRLNIALKGSERFGSVCLMFLDLDEFKHINDTLGHDAGDELLKQVSARLEHVLRDVDSIARIGGDEFTILLTGVQNTRSISGVADKIISALSEPFALNERAIYVTCSIGIALAETSNTHSHDILKQADLALYRAKQSGRNQYQFYTEELNRDADMHVYIRQSLKDTKRSDFRVVFQPQVDSLTSKIIGFEALTRWQCAEVSRVETAKCIKIIEESGLLAEFSEWLLKDILTTLQTWLPGMIEHNLTMSINISAKQLQHKTLASEIYGQCALHCIPPELIVLEVTETALIDDPERAANNLKRLKSMGFKIALDDFGTGYSSLQHLRKMPINCVKIDQSFVKDVASDSEDAQIVGAILSLTQALGLEVIAEGVEDHDVKDWLINNDCTRHQGFLYFKPMEKAQVDQFFSGSPLKFLPKTA